MADMKAVDVKDLAQLVAQTEQLNFERGFAIFRGQGIRGNLLPSVARLDPKRNTTKTERRLLAQVRALGASLLPEGLSADLDLLVLAQHFGLKTRLLDWTSNPLAAAWFACSGTLNGDGYVYALITDDLLDENIFSEDPFKQPETRVLQPRSNNARVLSQHGWFTLHRYSVGSSRFVALDQNPKHARTLKEFRIPADCRREMLRSLDRHGVNARTLYPDLQGLCSYLNWRESEA